MYIEFNMRSDGLWSWPSAKTLNKELELWSSKYHVPYKKKVVKSTLRVTFDDDKYYDLFALTWTPKSVYSVTNKWRLISDLNNRQD